MQKVLGILGAGQLAQLLAHRAYQLGVKTICFSDKDDVPAARVSELFIGDLNNKADLDKFSEKVDVITLENENIDIKTLEYLNSKKPLFPGVKSIEVAQDRWNEKSLFKDLNIPVTNFKKVDSVDDLKNLANNPNFTASILKTRRFGYDGKGQSSIDWSNFEKSWVDVAQAPCILEQKIKFTCEVSQVSARDVNGNIKHYPLIENEHEAGILKTSYCPIKYEDKANNLANNLTNNISKMAQDYISKLLNHFDYVGVLALELFVLEDGNLVANEIAPRVHNSGHLTNEAFDVGQFEMHVRAVCGGEIKAPVLKNKAIMHNLIGEISKYDYELANKPNIRLYDYGKEGRAGRKVGHWVEALELK